MTAGLFLKLLAAAVYLALMIHYYGGGTRCFISSKEATFRKVLLITEK